MKTCPFCKELLPGLATTCPACAEPLEVKPIAPVATPPEQAQKTSSNKSKRSQIKWIALLVLLAGVFAYSDHLAGKYRDFRNQLSAFRNIHLGDSREEVTYRLGMPTQVNGPPEKGEFGWWQKVYSVNAATNDLDAMPANTKVQDYEEWSYEEPNSQTRFTVKFNKTGVVGSLELYCDSSVRYGWGPVAGIRCGDSEEEIRRLGEPTRQKIDGVSKTIEYSDLGLEVILSKGKAYMVRINGVPTNASGVFWRFLRM